MTSQAKRTVLLIAGLKGNGCRETVTSALERVPGVRNVLVSLYRSSATIVHEPTCNTGDLIATIHRAGYGCELHT